MTHCGAIESECVCNRTTRHKIHRCECGGSWVYDEQGQFQVRTFPGGYKDPWSAVEYYLGPLTGLR